MDRSVRFHPAAAWEDSDKAWVGLGVSAFGLGLSYASELPEVEVEIEGDSEQWLIYWVAELTAGPNDAPWAITLRMHHRSPAFGLMGDEGGVNAMGLGLRWRF